MTLPTGYTNCPKCDLALIYEGQGSTLVGYYSPPGHDHNDNCKIHAWRCIKGHIICERHQNVCPAIGCDWKGKIECFCSPIGVSVSEKPVSIVRFRDGKQV